MNEETALRQKIRSLISEVEVDDLDDTLSEEGQEIRIECTDIAARQVVKLLRELKYMGDIGASRQIKIENYSDALTDKSFGFDGDGPAKIDKIEINGEEVE